MSMIKIVHLADIHVQDRRRAEYAAVFQSLYSQLQVSPPDIIVLAGDIFDNKMRASPHNLEDVGNFLTSLSRIAPIVMIPGNHDTNCLVPGSLDLLTPLITEHRALLPPRVMFWRSSGVYIAHEMIWTVIATDGIRPTEEEETAARTQYPRFPHICLFHEEVNGARFSNGIAMEDFKLGLSSFDRYDLTMGGHIHLRQQFAPRAGYCGSLIQQNIGESHIGHGYVEWQFSRVGIDDQLARDIQLADEYRTTMPVMTGVDIPNDNGFLRVIIDSDGNDITQIPIPNSPIFWEVVNFSSRLPAELLTMYTEKFGMSPRAIRDKSQLVQRVDNKDNKDNKEASDDSALWDAQLASKTLASHEDIIRELTTDDLAEAVVALHREHMNNDAPTLQMSASGGKFRILRMEFDNMYAFGPSNVVDFTMLEGCISGVVAANHTGKSSLSETLLFALYDEHPRAPLKKDVVHRGAKSCRIVLDFELDGKKGRIIKGLDGGDSKQRTSQYRFEYAGESRTKGGTTETIAEIRTVLGTASTALASSFQLQGGESGGFIGATPAGRKKLIADVMSLGSFESLERKVVREISEFTGEIKLLTGQFRGTNLDEITSKLSTLQSELISAKVGTSNCNNKLARCQDELQSSDRKLGIVKSKHDTVLSELQTKLCATPNIQSISVSQCWGEINLCNYLLGDTDSSIVFNSPTLYNIAGNSQCSMSEINGTQNQIIELNTNLDTLINEEVVYRIDMAKSESSLSTYEQYTHELESAVSTRNTLQLYANPPFDANLMSQICDITTNRRIVLQDCTLLGSSLSNSVIAALAYTSNYQIAELDNDEKSATRWNVDEYNQLLQEYSNQQVQILRLEGELSKFDKLNAPDSPMISTAPYPMVGERNTCTESLNESEALQMWTENKDYNLSVAATWNPEEYNRIEKILSSISDFGPLSYPQNEQDKLDSAIISHDNVLSKISMLKNSTYFNVATAEYTNDSSTIDPQAAYNMSLSELTEAIQWVAIAEHANIIRSKLTPVVGCVGCTHTMSLLNSDAVTVASHKLTLATANHLKAIADWYRQLSTAELTTSEYVRKCKLALSEAVGKVDTNNKRLKAVKIAKDKLFTLSETKKEYEKSCLFQRATSKLEHINYISMQSVTDWRIYNAEYAKKQALAEQMNSVHNSLAQTAQRIIGAEHCRVKYDIVNSIHLLEFANHKYEQYRQYCSATEMVKQSEKKLESIQHSVVAYQTLKTKHYTTVESIRYTKNKISKAEQYLSELKDRQKMIASNLQWWRTWLSLTEDYSRLIEVRNQYDDDIKKCKQIHAEAIVTFNAVKLEWSSASSREQSIGYEIAKLQPEMEHETTRLNLLSISTDKVAILKAYRAVLRPVGGIGDKLLERGRGTLNRYINSALVELGAQFTADIEPDYNVSILTGWQGTMKLPSSLGSGYQKFVLSLAARLAIWRLTSSPRPDAMIIDEGFGACDEEYLEAMTSALDALSSAPDGPKLIFVVTHVESMKVRMERILELSVLPSGSRVVHCRSDTQLTPAVEHKADRPDEKKTPRVDSAMIIIPDREVIGNIYCTVCSQSLPSGWSARHLKSAKHEKAVKKAKY